jgi:hypothetical protein
MPYSTSCGQDATGKLFQDHSELPVQYTIGSKNGGMQKCSRIFGRGGLLEYDAVKGINWEWQAMDGSMTKAPLGGKKHGTKSHRQSKIRSQKKLGR